MNSQAGKAFGDDFRLIQQKARSKYLGLLVVALLSLSPVMRAQQVTTYFPLLPKYQVLGVMYAPPGSASSVSYGNSTSVGSSNSQAYTSSNTTTQTSSSTLGFSLFGLFGSSTQNTVSDQFETSLQSGSSIAVTSMMSNNLGITGPLSSALGVNHDDDVIIVWLNPVTNTTLTYNPTGPTFSFNWQGYQYNSCDLTNPQDQVNFHQLISGCDPLQYPQADILLARVWCLKNPYSLASNTVLNTPCLQEYSLEAGQQLYFTRYWDQTPWGVDPKTGVPLGPGLTVQDFADILRADPYVTQTLVADNYQKSGGLAENPYTNPCHPTYGLNFDPDTTETIPDSSTFTAPFSGTMWPKDYCGAPNMPMKRQDNQGVNLSYQTGVNQSNTWTRTVLSAFAKTATDTHTHSVSQTTTDSFDIGAMIGVALSVLGPIDVGLSNLLNYSSSSGSGTSWTDVQSWSATNTTGSGSTAMWTVDGPAVVDKYLGPSTFGVYDDNVYGTYSFWSSQTRLNPPVLPTSSPIGVKMVTANGVTCTTPTTCNFGTVTVGKSSGLVTATLTNNSPYDMTMTSPSLSFSDVAPDATSGYTQVSSFVAPAANDLCAGKVLAAGKTCTVKIKFTPRLTNAPNTLKATYPVTAYMVASGTEGIPFYVGATCTTGYCSSVLVTNTVVNVTGPGQETFTTVSGTAVPAATTCTGIKPSCDIGATLTPAATDFPLYATSGTQAYTFQNYANTAVTVSGLQLTDTTDYSITSDKCTGVTIPSLKTCTFTLVYAAKAVGPALNTKISVLNGTTTLAYAGAAALLVVIPPPHINYSINTTTCTYSIPIPPYIETAYYQYDYVSWGIVDSKGVQHPFNVQTSDWNGGTEYPDCQYPRQVSTASGSATDGSGYKISVINYVDATVTSPTGVITKNY